MNKIKINKIFELLYLNNPKPQIELNFQTSFELLISVLLSAQSTDKRVNIVTKKLFKIASTPQQILALKEDKLKKFIKSIGLYNSKARNIIALCHMLVDKFQSEVPQNLNELCTLPGIGRKSANVILNTIWGHETIAVDTHVFRVSNRIGLCKTKNPLQTELKLMQVIPKRWILNAHHWLVLHGRYICKARKPLCSKCTINELCEYKYKDI